MSRFAVQSYKHMQRTGLSDNVMGLAESSCKTTWPTVKSHILTVSVPPPNLILPKDCPPAGYALVFPFILQFQLQNLLLCEPLHVGWQCDAMVCQLWDLCGYTNEQASQCQYTVS